MNEAFSKRISAVLETLMLLIFSVFLIFSPYGYKEVGKITYWFVPFFWFFIILLENKKYFYRKLIPLNPLNKPISLFSVACIFSILLSMDPYHSQKIFFNRYLLYAVYFWLGLGLAGRSRKNLYILTGAFFISGLVFSFGGVFDYLRYLVLVKSPYERLWSVYWGWWIPFYGFPLYLAYFAPFVFTFFCYSRNKKIRTFSFLILIFLLLCLAWNATRAAWISIIASFIFVYIIRKNKKSVHLLVGIVLLLVFIFSFSLYSQPIRQRIITIPFPSEWSFRLPLYNLAMSIFKDYPLFGAGIGMFEKIVPASSKYMLPADYPVSSGLSLHAHSTYFEMAAEMGTLGLGAFIFIFITFFRLSIANIRRPSAFEPAGIDDNILAGLTTVIAAILIFALSTTIITVGVNNSAYFWLLMGIATSLLPKGEVSRRTK
ncbi:MAG: hypothetical protein C4533_04045 [Candidatus Omnitrophota bacterium]|jgi:O-antigen ligase|nr:MAG: hypothetical protein C4533_04045 [Candidatus Omnitrophota bacterium]